MIKAIIFDCFGVLATEGFTAFKRKHFGHDPGLLQEVHDISAQADAGLISHEEAVKQTSDMAGVTPDEFVSTVFTNQPNEPLFDYIAELKDRYRIGMLSNASGNWLDEMFSPEQLALFDAINLSFESGFVKPDPRAYRHVAEKLGVEPEECVLVDDNERQCAGARDAGMKAVFYEEFDQAKAELEKILTDSKR